MTDRALDPSRRILRLILVCAGILAVLIVIGVAARQVYLHRMPARLAHQAQMALDRKEYNEASLRARRALQIDKDNVDARRVMARLAEHSGLLQEAMVWRRQVLKLQPNSLPDIVALAHSQLGFGKIADARKTFNKVTPKDRGTALYEICAADIAAAANEISEAHAHYERALTLDPQNEGYQFKRALLELRMLEKRADAQSVLRALAAKPEFKDRVRRALLADHMMNFEWSAALPLALELASEPKAAMKDKLLHLEVLRHNYTPQLETVLSALKSNAQEKPAEAAALIHWMQSAERLPEAIAWAKQLPQASQADPRVRAALALCYVKISDWAALTAVVSGDKWGSLEHLRLALFSRALRERGDLDLFRSTWNDAVAIAQKEPTRLGELLRLAGDWSWKTEQIDVLWALSAVPDSQMTALQSLYQEYYSKDDTAGLRRVTARLVEIDPKDDASKNNLLMYSFLLGSVSNADLEAARELYFKDPTSSVYVSTYAFALYCKGRADEALATMNTLRNDQLEDPSTAAYYAVFLQANGASELARKYLALSESAHLLPEEKKLVDQARRALQ